MNEPHRCTWGWWCRCCFLDWKKKSEPKTKKEEEKKSFSLSLYLRLSRSRAGAAPRDADVATLRFEQKARRRRTRRRIVGQRRRRQRSPPRKRGRASFAAREIGRVFFSFFLFVLVAVIVCFSPSTIKHPFFFLFFCFQKIIVSLTVCPPNLHVNLVGTKNDEGVDMVIGGCFKVD